MTSYHRFMHTLSLVLSAGAFRLATRLLDSAIHHKTKLNEEDDFLYFNEVEPPHFIRPVIDVHPNTWTDAEPEWLSGFDPIEPRYRRK